MDGFGLSVPLFTVAQLLQRLVATLVVVGGHGWLAALLANRLGDPGPKQDGRLSPSPLAHLDLIGVVHALFFRVTWMPRLDVDVTRLRGGRWGALALALGASAGLAALSALVMALRPAVLSLLRDSAAISIGALMNTTADFAIVAAVVHLLPVPPFVGAVFAPWARSPSSPWHGARLRWAAVVVLLLLSLSGVTARLVGPIAPAWRSVLGF